MNLYEINQQIRDVLSQVDEDGCLPDDAFDQLSELNQTFDIKIEAIACLVKEQLQTAKMIKEEVYALTKRQKSHENHADNMKQYLSDCMELSGKTKFETSKCAVSFRKSVGVVVDDDTLLPAKYLVAQEPTVSKAAIKDDLSAGIIVSGAHLETRQNVQVK